jgi:hypothetical protein
MSPRLEARLIERPEGNWKDFVAPGWPQESEPLVRAVVMNRVFGVDHRALSAALDSPIWSPATRIRLRARHSKVLEAAARWPDLAPPPSGAPPRRDPAPGARWPGHRRSGCFPA